LRECHEEDENGSIDGRWWRCRKCLQRVTDGTPARGMCARCKADGKQYRHRERAESRRG
jgi:rubrerythrin